MTLEKHICYEALKTRDARFDGQFFTGVRTTGIFCRPICPALTPKVENCTFFESAEAALEAGFRPCLRCRPESAPQSSAWIGTQAVVNRGLRLIEEGALDGEATLEDLAARLGIGARQLRRLFQKHVGLSPLKIAQTKRLMFAKKLLRETNLAITDIAFSSGFQSVRRFNDAFKTAFHVAPSRERKMQISQTESGALHLRLNYRPPFNWTALLSFFKSRQIDAIETITENSYQRRLKIEDEKGILQLTQDPDQPALILKLEGFSLKKLRGCVQKTRQVFDLDCDPRAVHSCLADDLLIGPLVHDQPGLRLPGAWCGFEIAVRALIGQQISVKAARTLLNRLVDHCQSDYFPTPEQILNCNLGALGLTRSRQNYLKNLCENWRPLDPLLPVEQHIDQLCQVNGIGPWTAHYIVMRTLSHPDCFPVNDLALLRRFQSAGFGQTHAEVTDYFEKIRPWRAYGAIYLWQSEA